MNYQRPNAGRGRGGGGGLADFKHPEEGREGAITLGSKLRLCEFLGSHSLFLLTKLFVP